MSTILCVIDGMTDPSFQATEYPSLSSMRFLGNLQTTPEGYEAESLTCILTLLGVKRIPKKLRGYAEALGAGIPVKSGDLIVRGSWFALDAAGFCTVPAKAPLKVNPSSGAVYHWLEDYKSLFVLPGMAECIVRVETYPPYRCAGKAARSFCPSENSALEKLFNALLSDDLCMIPWGESVPALLPPFPHLSAVVCGTNIVRGIARLLQMKLIPVVGATGDIDTNLAAKTAAALRAAQTYPFVLLHINGADEAAHRLCPEQKRTFLHKVDSLVLPWLLGSAHTVYVASDHASDPASGLHGGIEQPVFTGRN
jgi:2,3-bisphosphoglycerate-independent phosphoglycerate mutase